MAQVILIEDNKTLNDLICSRDTELIGHTPQY